MKSIKIILTIWVVCATACNEASEPSPNPTPDILAESTVISTPTFTPDSQVSLVPALEYPAEGTIMDNARGNDKTAASTACNQ